MIGLIVVSPMFFLIASEPPHHIEYLVFFHFNPQFQPLPNLHNGAFLILQDIHSPRLFSQIFQQKPLQLKPIHAELLLKKAYFCQIGQLNLKQLQVQSFHSLVHVFGLHLLLYFVICLAQDIGRVRQETG